MAEEEIRRNNGGSPINGQVPPVEHRFKPGNQASKGVRTGKGHGIVAEFKRLLNQICDEDPQRRKYKQIAAKALMQQFLKGNGVVVRQMLDRLEGPVPTKLEGGDPDKPILIADAKNRLTSQLNRLAARSAETGGDSEPECGGS